MEPCKLDIKGPAMLVCVISESKFDRYAFNDLVDHYIGHNVGTKEELELINDKFWKFHECVGEHFTTTLVGGDREKIREFHKSVIEQMEKDDTNKNKIHHFPHKDYPTPIKDEKEEQ